MEYLSLVGIIVSVAVMVYGCVKSANLVVLTTICALIIATTGGLSIVDGYGAIYMDGMGSFIASQFPVFLSGALFSAVLGKTGMTRAIALELFRRFGKKRIMLAMLACNIILAAGGVNTFVIILTVVPIALTLFEEADLPRRLIPACILGPTVAACMLPGLPTLNNTIPASALGVSVMAAPYVGLIGAVLQALLSFLYMNLQMKKCRSRGEHYDPAARADDCAGAQRDLDLPKPSLALIPLAFILVTLNVFGFPVYVSLFGGTILLALILHRRLGNSINYCFAEAVRNSQVIITTAALSGFGAVVAAVPGYRLIEEGLRRVSFGNPYFFTVIAVAILAAISASAYGSMRIAATVIRDRVLMLGGNPQVVCRLMTMSALACGSMPHNSAFALTFSCCGITLREGYKDLFITTLLIPLLISAFCAILGSMGLC